MAPRPLRRGPFRSARRVRRRCAGRGCSPTGRGPQSAGVSTWADFTSILDAMLKKLLIANRGEIAIRIAQAAAELGIATAGIHSEDDATSLHVRRVDEVLPIKGRGAAAYLDIDGVI